MNPFPALLAPLLLFPVAIAPGVLQPAPDVPQDGWALVMAEQVPGDSQPRSGDFDLAAYSPISWVMEAFRAPTADQARIEQHIVIRIAPAAPPEVVPRPDARNDARRNFAADMASGGGSSSRIAERGMGKCVPVSGIAGVQISAENRLILFMRDQRIVSAALEKGCGARDFYSGFYVERSADGMMCSGRETLQSRTGVSCKLGKLKQLVEAGE
jgi:hypothetical protein